MNAAWTEVTLDEACADVSSFAGRAPKSAWREKGSLALIDQGDSTIAGYTDDETLRYRGDLPVIAFGDHTRRLKFIDHPFGVGADGVKLLKPSPSFDARFLYRYLASQEIPSGGYSRHFKFLRRLTVPLPPLDEQRRIARVLDAAESVRASARAAANEVLTLLDSEYVSTFTQHGCGWPLRRLDDVAVIVTGNTPPRSEAANYGAHVEWIKNDNVATDWPYVKPSEEGLSELGAASGRIAPAGAVMVTCISGSPAAIGRVALTDRAVAFNQQINAAIPREMDPAALYLQMRTSRERIRALSTGGMKGLISKSALSGMQIVMPDQDSQEALRRMFDASVSVLHRLADRQRVTSELFASLQHRAFRGEL